MPTVWEWVCVLGKRIKSVLSRKPGQIKNSSAKDTSVNGFCNTVTSRDTIINVNGPVTIQNDPVIERDRKQNREVLLKALQSALSECKLYYRGEGQPGYGKPIREGLLECFGRFLKSKIDADWIAAKEPKAAMRQNYVELLEVVNKGGKEEDNQQGLSGNDLRAKRIARDNALVEEAIALLKQMVAITQEDYS